MNDEMQRSCTVLATSPYADDLYVGVCLHDAGVLPGAEPCMYNLHHLPTATQRAACNCGATFHLRKTTEQQLASRDKVTKCRSRWRLQVQLSHQMTMDPNVRRESVDVH